MTGPTTCAECSTTTAVQWLKNTKTDEIFCFECRGTAKVAKIRRKYGGLIPCFDCGKAYKMLAERKWARRLSLYCPSCTDNFDRPMKFDLQVCLHTSFVVWLFLTLTGLFNLLDQVEVMIVVMIVVVQLLKACICLFCAFVWRYVVPLITMGQIIWFLASFFEVSRGIRETITSKLTMQYNIIDSKIRKLKKLKVKVPIASLNDYWSKTDYIDLVVTAKQFKKVEAQTSSSSTGSEAAQEESSGSEIDYASFDLCKE